VFGALCGAAFLTKGFVALAVPTVAITPLMLWQRRWRELLGYGAWSVVVATAVAAPWALSVHAREPDYWRYFFWEEHVRRFASNDAQHPQPFWYFLPFALAMTLPWTGAVPAALRLGWRHGVRAGGPFERLMLLAVLAPLLFFSLAQGKLATYILPCFPPFAILIGNAIVDGLDQGRKPRAAMVGAAHVGPVECGPAGGARSRGVRPEPSRRRRPDRPSCRGRPAARDVDRDVGAHAAARHRPRRSAGAAHAESGRRDAVHLDAPPGHVEDAAGLRARGSRATAGRLHVGELERQAGAAAVVGVLPRARGPRRR
jgi:hypothetical protein